MNQPVTEFTVACDGSTITLYILRYPFNFQLGNGLYQMIRDRSIMYVGEAKENATELKIRMHRFGSSVEDACNLKVPCIDLRSVRLNRYTVAVIEKRLLFMRNV